MAKRQLATGFGPSILKRRKTAKEGKSPTGALSTATGPGAAIGNREGCAAPRWSGARNTGGKGAGTLVPTNSRTSTEDHVHASHNFVEGLDDGAPMAATAGVGAADCDIQASAKPEDAAEVSSSNEVKGGFVVEEQRAVKNQRQAKPRSVRGRGAGRASSGTGRRGSPAAACTAKRQGARISTSVRGRARGKRLASGRGIQASAKPDAPDQVSSSTEVEAACVVEEQRAVKSQRPTEPRSVRGRGAGRASSGTGRRGKAAAACTAKKQGARISTSVRGRGRGKRLASGRALQASGKPNDPDQASSSNDVEGRCVVEEQGAVKCQRQTKPRSVRGRGAGRASRGTGGCCGAAAAATRKKQGARPSTSVRGGVRGKRPASGRGRGIGRVKGAAKLRTCQEDQQDKEDGDGVSAVGRNHTSKDEEAPAGTSTENCEEGGRAKPTRRLSRRVGKPKREAGDIDVTVEDQGTATLSNARAGKKRRAQAKPTRRKPLRAEKPKREPGDIDVAVEDQVTARHSNARTGKKRRAQAVVPTTGECERTQYKAYEVREAFDSFLEDLETTCKQRGVTMTADELQRLALHRWSSMSIKEKADCVARMHDRFSLGLPLSIRPWRLRMTLREQPTPADFVRQSKELYNWGRVRLKVTQSHD